jgi:DNA-binding SARP family transcriptional activator
MPGDAFELLPFPVIVCGRDGAIVSANQAYLRSPASQARSCCELLGCGRDDGPLAGRCVTREVLESPSRSWSVQAGELGVSAWRLTGDSVVYRLRPPGESPEPVDPAPAARPRLRVFTLGSLRVEREDGRDLGEDWLDQRPGQLLKFLVAHRGRGASHDEIAEVLWPRLGSAGPGTVRHAVHLLRRRVEEGLPEGTRSYVRTQRGMYAVDLSIVWVDADACAAAVRTGLQGLVDRGDPDAERHLLLALRLYQGDFLADEPYAEWAFAERERLRAMITVPLRALADDRIDRGDLEAALTFVDRLARLEPFDADIQRQLIGLNLGLGRRSRALRLYEAFEARLRREFGDRPPFTLHELLAQVSAGPISLGVT